MNEDPRLAIARLPMTRLQMGIVALCIAMTALDGFDVLAISFASPGIAAEWGIDRAMLGIVLSMELIGMAVGSVLIGNVADRIGRRPTILACLIVMTVGMFTAAAASGVAMLSVTRLLTGLGIGGMLPSTSAMSAEFSNDKRRDLNVMLNVAGYPAGAIIGGAIASMLLANSGDWRNVFLFGGVITALFVPLAYFCLPESIDSQIARRPANALGEINRTLKRLGMSVLDALPAPPAHGSRPSFAALFSPVFAPLTILLTVGYIAHVMSFYYILKWIPKIVVDLGFAPSTAGGVLVCANVGGMLGAVSLGLMAQRIALRPVIIGGMLCAFVMITVFGLGHHELVRLSLVAGIVGFFTNGTVVGMYAILAQTYPAALRASGTGFVIGVGRGGSALGPIVAGKLFASGSGLFVVSLAMGSGALIAAILLLFLPWAQARSRRAELLLRGT